MPTSTGHADLDWYIAHQDELVRAHNGKSVVIKNCAILSVYDDDLTALEETIKLHAPGSFIIQRVGPGPENYTATFHSLAG